LTLFYVYWKINADKNKQYIKNGDFMNKIFAKTTLLTGIAIFGIGAAVASGRGQKMPDLNDSSKHTPSKPSPNPVSTQPQHQPYSYNTPSKVPELPELLGYGKGEFSHALSEAGWGQHKGQNEDSDDYSGINPGQKGDPDD